MWLMYRAAVAAAAVVAVAACSSTPPPGLPAWNQAAAFSCAVTGDGTGVTVRVPGDGRRARLAGVTVRVTATGQGRDEHVIAVPGHTVPASGVTLRWDGLLAGVTGPCKVTGYSR